MRASLLLIHSFISLLLYYYFFFKLFLFFISILLLGALFCYEPLSYSTQRILLLSGLTDGSEIYMFSNTTGHLFAELEEASPTSLSAPPRVWNCFFGLYQAVFEKKRREGGRGGDGEGGEVGEGGDWGGDEGFGEKNSVYFDWLLFFEFLHLFLMLTFFFESNFTPYPLPPTPLFHFLKGGAPTSPIVWDFMKNKLKKVIASEGYGATEVGAIASSGVRKFTTVIFIESVEEVGGGGGGKGR